MIDLMLTYGSLILFVFMLTNGFASTPPSELVLAAAGAVAVSTDESLFVTCAIAVLGNFSGAVLLYLTGKHLNRLYVLHFVNFILTKLLRLKGNKGQQFINRIEMIVQKESVFILLYMRCLPVVRSIVSLPAGLANISLLRFSFLSIIGMTIWAYAWIFIGANLYDRYQQSQEIVSLVLLFILALSFFSLHKKAKKIINSYGVNT